MTKLVLLVQTTAIIASLVHGERSAISSAASAFSSQNVLSAQSADCETKCAELTEFCGVDGQCHKRNCANLYEFTPFPCPEKPGEEKEDLVCATIENEPLKTHVMSQFFCNGRAKSLTYNTRCTAGDFVCLEINTDGESVKTSMAKTERWIRQGIQNACPNMMMPAAVIRQSWIDPFTKTPDVQYVHSRTSQIVAQSSSAHIVVGTFQPFFVGNILNSDPNTHFQPFKDMGSATRVTCTSIEQNNQQQKPEQEEQEEQPDVKNGDTAAPTPSSNINDSQITNDGTSTSAPTISAAPLSKSASMIVTIMVIFVLTFM